MYRLQIKFLTGVASARFMIGNPCDYGSCYPATGNLLIGREKSLTATSTCGLQNNVIGRSVIVPNKRCLIFQERYCVSDLEQTRKNCFQCDSRNQTLHNRWLNHKIENVVHRFGYAFCNCCDISTLLFLLLFFYYQTEPTKKSHGGSLKMGLRIYQLNLR